MNLPARSVLSCRLFPNLMGDKFMTLRAKKPVIYPYAGVDFRLCFFNTDTELYVTSNIATLYLTIKDSASGTTLLSTSIVSTAMNHGCTLDEWNAGTAQHAVISLTGAQTAALANKTSAFLTVWGTTSDDVVDNDVFGIADVEVVNAGLSAVTPAETPGTTFVTTEMLTGLLGNYIRAGLNPAGTWFGLVSPNNQHTVVIRSNDDGSPSFDLN